MELGEDFAPDSSCLKRHHKATVSAQERTKLDKDFQNRIEELTARLSKTSPNLKALEQYNQVSPVEKIKERKGENY